VGVVILVDSDVLIRHLRGDERAQEWLLASRGAGEVLAVSVVTVAEILGGMRSGERRDVRRLLDALPCLPADERIGERAGEYRRRYRRSHAAIGTADYLIAATASVHGALLATLNVRHFPMVEGLQAPF
jgi:hypothetical protein